MNIRYPIYEGVYRILTIEQTGRGLSVDLFGEILLGYDEEKDLLYLSTEGEYVRADEL